MNAFGHEQWKCDKITFSQQGPVHWPSKNWTDSFKNWNLSTHPRTVYLYVIFNTAKLGILTCMSMGTDYLNNERTFLSAPSDMLETESLFSRKHSMFWGGFQGFSVMDRYWDCGLHDFLPWFVFMVWSRKMHLAQNIIQLVQKYSPE